MKKKLVKIKGKWRKGGETNQK